MIKFIEVTEPSEFEPTIVNIDHIIRVRNDDNGEGVWIHLTSTPKSMQVKESVDEVIMSNLQ